MPKKFDPKEAERIMRSAGAIPLEPFKGTQSKWKCQCKTCREIIYPVFNSVNSQGTNPCKHCAVKQSGETRRNASARAAIAIMRKSKIEPLEEFPGVHKPWKSRCLKCNKVISPHFSSVKNGSGCIYCAGRKVDDIDARKFMKSRKYELLEDFSGATKKWKSKHLPCGKIVYPKYTEIKAGVGCRHCFGNAKISESDARKLFLKNKLEPLEPFINSQLPWKSRCLITGKTVSPTYGKVRDHGHRCKYCSENVTDEVDAIALMKAAGFKTLVPYPGAQKPWKSQCLKCKKIHTPNFTSVKLGFGCKYCTHRAVDPSDAAAAMKARGFKTFGPFPGASKPWKVQCLKCKNKYETKFHSLNTKTSCKFCMGAVIHPDDLSSRLKDLKLKPLEEFPGARTPWKIQCLRCNRIVTPSWTHLTRRDRNVGGCVFCSKRRVHMDDTVKLMALKKLRPIGPYVNGKTPWLCKCLKCKREVYPRVTDLRSGQSGCIYCAGLRVDVRLAIKLANKNGFTPIVPYPGAKQGWECRCNICGEVSKPHYTSMQQGINRCKHCATGGFLFNSPAIIYLITNKNLGAHKIGVAGAFKHNERLKKHAKQGWSIYKHKQFLKGEEAFNIEQKVLNWLRNKKNLEPFLTFQHMPQAGWTETVDASEIDLPTIWAKVEELSRVKR